MKVPPNEAGNHYCPFSMAGQIKVCLGPKCMAWVPTYDFITVKLPIFPSAEFEPWPDYSNGPDEKTYRRPVGYCGMQRWIG